MSPPTQRRELTRSAFTGLLVGALTLLTACDSAAPAAGPFDPNPGDAFNATFGPAFVGTSFVAAVTHPFFPLVPGTTYTFQGATAGGNEVVVVEVLNDTRVVAGVTARVVRDRVYLDGILIEDTIDWYAQDDEGNVWYLGEETCEFVAGVCVSTEGSWEAGVDGARAGIVMPADPATGQRFYQEYYNGEAEDRAEVLSTSASVTVPFGSFTNCVQTLDTTPLDADVQEHKFYCAGAGFALEVHLDSGDRLELQTVAGP